MNAVLQAVEAIQRRLRMRRSARCLSERRVRHAALAQAWCILVCCVRNEQVRLPAFLEHYRRLGVAHFLFVDNQSTDGLQDYLDEQVDCSSWLACGRYSAANFGMDWCNLLLAAYGPGKWCVTVDPDEFLVFPYHEERGLRGLTRYMEGSGQQSLYTPLIDAYGRERLSRVCLLPGMSPFEACPYFDRLNLSQKFDARKRNWWLQGGPRMRCFMAEQPQFAPALNKIALVRWACGLHYVSSTHHLNRTALNCSVLDNPFAVSGVLFHFKYVSLLRYKSEEELVRGEHYAGGREYRAYLGVNDPVLFDSEVSITYRGARQLVDLGFMQCGGWF